MTDDVRRWLKDLGLGGLMLVLVSLPGGASAGTAEDINRARKMGKAGDFQSSVNLYGQVIDNGGLYGKELADVYYSRGLMYDRLRQNDAAIADYKAAIAIDPAHIAAWSSICFQLIKEKPPRLDDALSVCNQALRLDPKHAPSYGIRAEIWVAKGNKIEAEKDYDHALRLDAGNWQLHFNRGIFYHRNGRKDDARRDFNEAYRLAPGWGRTHPSTVRLFKEYGGTIRLTYHSSVPIFRATR
jgi:tetratricopeptide (TPR) repeat protein